VSQEHQPDHEARAERSENLSSLGHERLEQLRSNPEHETDSSEQRAEAAREAIQKAEHKSEPEPAPAAPKQHHRPLTLDHRNNYQQTLHSLQRHLSPVSRRFSNVIHNSIVERASEGLEKTVARPSVTAGTTWTALIVGATFYFTARNYGYMLSGSELLFSFVVGALIGVLVEALWRALFRRA
jgi:hypothetical protein